MNKKQKVLIFMLGVFCLFCTFSFIFNLGAVEKIITGKQSVGILVAIAAITVSGVGIELGARIVLGIFRKNELIIALIFSVFMFFMQLLFTVGPGISKCKCASISESIMKISDWRQVEYSFGLLIYCLAVYFIAKPRSKSQAGTISCVKAGDGLG